MMLKSCDRYPPRFARGFGSLARDDSLLFVIARSPALRDDEAIL